MKGREGERGRDMERGRPSRWQSHCCTRTRNGGQPTKTHFPNSLDISSALLVYFVTVVSARSFRTYIYARFCWLHCVLTSIESKSLIPPSRAALFVPGCRKNDDSPKSPWWRKNIITPGTYFNGLALLLVYIFFTFDEYPQKHLAIFLCALACTFLRNLRHFYE